MSEFSTWDPLISISTTYWIQKFSNLSSYFASFSLALLKTSSATTFSFKKLMEGFVLSLWIRNREKYLQHFSNYSQFPKMTKMVEKDQLRFFERYWGLILDFTNESQSGMILFLMRVDRTFLNRDCILMYACFFSLCMTLMMQQLGLILLFSVRLLEVSSTYTRPSSSRSLADREDSQQRLCVCVVRQAKAKISAKMGRGLIFLKIIQIILALKNNQNNGVTIQQAHIDLASCLDMIINRINKLRCKWLITYLHQATSFKLFQFIILAHSQSISDSEDSSEEEECCQISFSSGSLLNRLRQMLMASQCRFLSLTLDSLIQFRASFYKKLRKMSLRIQWLIIFFIRLLLYFLRYSRVLQVRIASRINLRSNMLTFQDLRNEIKALQKFFEMFLVFLSWSYSPSLLRRLLLIFLKMQTFLPSVLSFVSFLSLSLVETASLGSLGNCSG